MDTENTNNTAENTNNAAENTNNAAENTNNAAENTNNAAENTIENTNNPNREYRPRNEEGGNSNPNREYRPRREGSSEEGGNTNKYFNKRSKFGAFKRKKCRFCGKEKKVVDKEINYKNVELLEKFISDRGKILPSRATGNCATHQRKTKVEVKKARYIAFLPFARVEKLNK